MAICTLTEKAIQQIDSICDENDAYAVCLDLKGGGCAGFEYDWITLDAATDIEKNDVVIGRFVIRAASVMYLIGTEIDYVRNLVGSNFDIKNPNAESACGCGVSINFDIDKLDNSLAVAI